MGDRMTVAELRRITDKQPWLAEARVKHQAAWAFVVLPGLMTLGIVAWVPVFMVFCLLDGLLWVAENAATCCDRLVDRITRFLAYAEWRAS